MTSRRTSFLGVTDLVIWVASSAGEFGVEVGCELKYRYQTNESGYRPPKLFNVQDYIISLASSVRIDRASSVDDNSVRVDH